MISNRPFSSAASCGWVSRPSPSPSGYWRSTFASVSFVAAVASRRRKSAIGASCATAERDTQFARMRDLPYSFAKAFVKPMAAAFAAE